MRLRFIESYVDANHADCFRLKQEYEVEEPLASELVRAAVAVPAVAEETPAVDAEKKPVKAKKQKAEGK